ncbi:AAA family ATPase [Streptomyces himalayensis]|uniref:ATP-binding protein n=1 Tax=Streptomyces himalayensis subsp. himalayensis TaxID=2756131 RepID=A0A7W0DTU9_9ACTN|nr:ATP-binding protein [Streptomyces himalayensis]MBA2950790.1 ATP-binding protein [Streptomyces himalayensis subsp. himalayensis]
MFDRDFEWSELVRFVTYPGPEATLGVVSGRRRQGKTFLLDGIARATDGFFFAASEATEAESLRQYGVAMARFEGRTVPYRFTHWDEAVEATMHLATARTGPLTVVIDEFPFLAKASPELPSLLQRALGPQGRREGGPVRLLLCGSALSFMGNLLSGTAPLRGRASLELIVPTLDFRLAADFWGITDPRLAMLVNSVVGGTPAYGREFTLGDVPADLDDFGPWILRNILNPGRPLFREARFLLAEEPDLRDTALYHGVLAAIAQGNHTRGGIASFLERKSTDLGHALTVLEDTGMISREPDAFHGKRSAYRINEPILTFYYALMRPEWSDLERPGQAESVWQRSHPTFRSKVIGPHFEQLCRTWTRWYASPDTLGGQRTRVESGTVADTAARASHEVDLAAFGRDEDGRETLLAIGEAKWNETMGFGHVQRLEHIRDLIRARGTVNAPATRLLCFSGAGFTDDLHTRAAHDPNIQLVDLERLYKGA